MHCFWLVVQKGELEIEEYSYVGMVNCYVVVVFGFLFVVLCGYNGTSLLEHIVMIKLIVCLFIGEVLIVVLAFDFDVVVIHV